MHMGRLETMDALSDEEMDDQLPQPSHMPSWCKTMQHVLSEDTYIYIDMYIYIYIYI